MGDCKSAKDRVPRCGETVPLSNRSVKDLRIWTGMGEKERMIQDGKVRDDLVVITDADKQG